MHRDPRGDDIGLRRIIHVDMDAFFASVEQRDNPELRGRPVAVGRSRRRGVVAAASYEARIHGVRSAMPSVTALRRCPDLVFVPPRFDAYRAVSKEIHEIFRQHTDLVEPLSLDEAYLDVTDACRDGTSATEIAIRIRSSILDVTGLTASAGVSYNKFLAKIASDQDKPDGLTVITPRHAPDFVAGLPVGRFHGVGPVTEKRMLHLGIRTGADLRRMTLASLERHFGSSAPHYHSISRGIDDRPVNPDRERKSIGAEQTFNEDLHDTVAASQALYPIIDKVMDKCSRHDVHGRTVTLKVKYSDFSLITRRRTLTTPLDEAQEVFAIAQELLSNLAPFPKGVRLLGVSLSGFTGPEPDDPDQPDLFDM